ncbi:hypothetical protein [Actinomadura rudentiformis]|uniref:Uncharacterized protein n=1 Tax=Actinomadura rudentiformis TaxID=359158 RepID=A0A6H9YPV7_9ACTN|nr:hypothetical protein [Actinomadura rudentiformis]KAB2344871.1 hypothetical protein F8566_30225 [Actinomadura rudentiformis]
MDQRTRIFVIAIAVLMSVIAGLVAAWLKTSGTASIADAVLYGFAAFGGTLGLVLLVVQVYRSL